MDQGQESFGELSVLVDTGLLQHLKGAKDWWKELKPDN